MTKIDFTDSLEKIPVKIFPSPKEGSEYVATVIAQLIKVKNAEGKKAVIGLATGSTPKTLYAELVRMHNEDGLSFKNVITFNLDQYYPMDKDGLQSYHYFMRKYLFEHTDIDPANYFVPDGMIAKDQVKEHCRQYEQQIEDAGGLDLQILGIGQNGHIGFNEPGSGIYTKTRLITLDNSTRIANAYEFGNMSQVPRMAITMGIQTILKSKKIILLAWGQTKAPVLQKAVEKDDTEDIPASLLQNHDDCSFVVDEAAASELTRFKYPWLTGECEWDSKMIKRAVINLAL
ncbi:MAG TPA: glucosamine-6-phosphate deaminase, partial [Ferruginibacter sp.]|nr:glucosamine-6-phosphate deaminase [Ferruginibacter sp.]